MVKLDGLLEAVLALAGLGIAANVAFAVLVWVYAVLVIGGSAVAGLLAVLFVAVGTPIVWGFVRLYLG